MSLVPPPEQCSLAALRSKSRCSECVGLRQPNSKSSGRNAKTDTTLSSAHNTSSVSAESPQQESEGRRQWRTPQRSYERTSVFFRLAVRIAEGVRSRNQGHERSSKGTQEPTHFQVNLRALTSLFESTRPSLALADWPMFARAPLRVKAQLVRWRVAYEIRKLWKQLWRRCSSCAKRSTGFAVLQSAATTELLDEDGTKPSKKRKVLGPPRFPGVSESGEN